jgi:hypothetical protein
MATRVFAVWIFCAIWTAGLAQTDQPPAWQLTGYVKNLQNWSWAPGAGGLLRDGFLHNRLTLKWTPDTIWTFESAVRTRLFYGESVSAVPGFADQLDRDNGLWDGAIVWVRQSTWVLQSQIDRLALGWQRGRWSIKAGRQRINWGIATTWNPNDLFNTYNFLDFDYEERPGTDAIRVKYRTGSVSSLEAAVSPGRTEGSRTVAIRYSTNWRGYDLQFLGGRYHRQWTAGLGWAGNLGPAGFKGEFGIFKPNGRDSALTVSASMQVDHMFAHQWYVSGGVLYVSAAPDGPVNLASLAATTLGPDRLMPVRWSFLATVAKPITPILNGSCTLVWSPEYNLLILVPTLAYNIRENWDIDFTGQLFYIQPPGNSFKNQYNGLFLRLRWSF